WPDRRVQAASLVGPCGAAPSGMVLMGGLAGREGQAPRVLRLGFRSPGHLASALGVAERPDGARLVDMGRVATGTRGGRSAATREVDTFGWSVHGRLRSAAVDRGHVPGPQPQGPVPGCTPPDRGDPCMCGVDTAPVLVGISLCPSGVS